MAGMALGLGIFEARAAVRLDLRIPEAETYVLGDVIPLIGVLGTRARSPSDFSGKAAVG